ncbi:MAG: LptF/LptG family permease [Gemmatimonadetes bacterium]|nr:LptF/LptG family permease [Gemmatimonadota bacterium]
MFVDVIDPETSELGNVRIHDMSQYGVRRTTYAVRGTMDLNSTFTDLHLRLFDGYSYEFDSREEGSFRRTNFEEQLYVMRGVGNLFEDAGSDQRSDREMSVAMLLDAREERLGQLEGIRSESRETAKRAVDRALGLGAVSDSARAGAGRPPPGVVPGGPLLPRDELVRSTASTSRAEMGRYSTTYRFANQVGVEINKKIVISTACVIFVLIGVPICISFPRGGVNMVIVVSSVVIGVYQVGLTTGEKWADRGMANPFWTMWAPSIIFLVLGVFLVSRMGQWTAAVRGSDWREIWLATRNLLGRFRIVGRRRGVAA